MSTVLTCIELLETIVSKKSFDVTQITTINNISRVVKNFRKNNYLFELMYYHNVYHMHLEEANLSLIYILKKFKWNIAE